MRFALWLSAGLSSLSCCFAELLQIEPLSWEPRIFRLKQFLSLEECDHLIDLAEGSLTRSLVLGNCPGEDRLDGTRTSSGMFLPSRGCDSIVSAIEQRIAVATQIPLAHGENLQILHYGVGGEYRPHYDYFDRETAAGAACIQRGGQRIATLIIYLHTTEAGGETIFPLLNLKIMPKKGDALLFYSCFPSGKEDPLTLHGGAPVLVGEKWIATKWMRIGLFD